MSTKYLIQYNYVSAVLPVLQCWSHVLYSHVPCWSHAMFYTHMFHAGHMLCSILTCSMLVTCYVLYSHFHAGHMLCSILTCSMLVTCYVLQWNLSKRTLRERDTVLNTSPQRTKPNPQIYPSLSI